jgi:hypothetical protein
LYTLTERQIEGIVGNLEQIVIPTRSGRAIGYETKEMSIRIIPRNKLLI